MTRHLPAALAIVAALVVARVVRRRPREVHPGACHWGHVRGEVEDDVGDLRERALRTGAA